MGTSLSNLPIDEDILYSYQVQSTHPNSPASQVYKTKHDCRADIQLSVAIKRQKALEDSQSAQQVSLMYPSPKCNELQQEVAENSAIEDKQLFSTEESHDAKLPAKHESTSVSQLNAVDNHGTLRFPNQIIPFLDHIISLDTIPVSYFETNPSFYRKYLERSVGQSICLRVLNIMTDMSRDVWLKPEWKNEPTAEMITPLNAISVEDDSFYSHEKNQSQDKDYNAWLGLNCKYSNIRESKFWVWRILSVLEDTEASRHSLKCNDFILGVNNTLFSSNDKWPKSVEKILVYRWDSDIIEELYVDPHRELGCEIAMGGTHSNALFERWRNLWTEEAERISQNRDFDASVDRRRRIHPDFPTQMKLY